LAIDKSGIIFTATCSKGSPLPFDGKKLAPMTARSSGFLFYIDKWAINLIAGLILYNFYNIFTKNLSIHFFWELHECVRS